MSGFFERLGALVRERTSMLCVGLDSDIERLPACCLREDHPQFAFNREIIEATKDRVAVYKINLAFYESQGHRGMESLEKTLEYIPEEIPVIGDAKRGDIGNTGRHYAHALFDVLNFDAVTLNPYMGYDSLAPFLGYSDRGVFVLCLTSNPGAEDFQIPNTLYLHVARKCAEWNNEFGNVGLVVGAPYPEQLKQVREAFPSGWFLVPGVGAQGGDLKSVLNAGKRSADDTGMIINISRSIIFASREDDFADKARSRAKDFLVLMQQSGESKDEPYRQD